MDGGRVFRTHLLVQFQGEVAARAVVRNPEASARMTSSRVMCRYLVHTSIFSH